MRYAIVIFALLIAPAYAADIQEQTPKDQALLTRLQTEIGVSLQCSEAYIGTQRVLTAAQARIKELEDKYEPKPVEPAK